MAALKSETEDRRGTSLGDRTSSTESVGTFAGDDDDDAGPAPPDLTVGTQIAGRYQVLSVAGRGGYATVYLAFDLQTEQQVAVKVIRNDRVSPTALKRLAREAEAARLCAHENVVRVLDGGRFGDSAFLVMEAVVGQTLRDRLKTSRMSADEALRVAMDILSGLQALHRLGIVHRDVKPGNILIDQNGRARLADFGLVTRWDEDQSRATRSHAVVGTVEYVSPEQALGDALDGRSDLYALGVVLFEMLTGERPHGAGSSLGVLVAHLTKPAPDVRASREDIPAWVAGVVEKLLAKRREDRYASAEEALSDIRNRRAPTRLTDGFPALSHARRQWPAVLVIAALGLAGVLGVWGTWPATSPIAPRPRVVGAEVKGGLLRALDDKGAIVWTRDLGAPLSEEPFSGTSLLLMPRLRVADLDGDGENEVLIAAAGETGRRTDLVVFEGDGRERFRRQPGHRVTYGDEEVNAFSANATFVFIDSRGRRRLFLLSNHLQGFPSVLEELDSQGRLIAEYFGSGHQTLVRRMTLRGVDVLALGGFHNETRGASATFLRLDDISGRSPGMNRAYVCTSCKPQDPLSMIVLTRSDVARAAGGVQASANVIGILRGEDGSMDIASLHGRFPDIGHPAADASVRYSFSEDFKQLLELRPSELLVAAHNAFFKDGRLDHRFGASDLDELRQAVIWDGRRWASIPAR